MGDHPPISYQYQSLEAKVLAQLLDLIRQCARIGRVALVYRDGHRATGTIGQQSVVHLQGIALAITAVADLSQRATTTFEVTRAQVIQPDAAGAEGASGKLLLNGRLALEQPVHRRVQIVFILWFAKTPSGSKM